MGGKQVRRGERRAQSMSKDSTNTLAYSEQAPPKLAPPCQLQIASALGFLRGGPAFQAPVSGGMSPWKDRGFF